jgi:hypothetical protein
MKNTIIIKGASVIAITEMVKKYTENLKTVYINYYDLTAKMNNNFIFRDVEKDTEFIVIEDCPYLRQIQWLLRADCIKINKKNKEPFTIKRPTIIIISNNLEL